MAAIENFQEKKRELTRGVSNQDFLAEVSDYFSDADCILVVGRFPNGKIEVYNTQNNSLETIGLAEIAKQHVIDTMRG